jgi:hypothetical protein
MPVRRPGRELHAARRGKHVPSRVPIAGVGPSDARDQVSRHKGVNSGPTTVGPDPNRPARWLASENSSLTSGTPAAGSAPAAFPPYEGSYSPCSTGGEMATEDFGRDPDRQVPETTGERIGELAEAATLLRVGLTVSRRPERPG